MSFRLRIALASLLGFLLVCVGFKTLLARQLGQQRQLAVNHVERIDRTAVARIGWTESSIETEGDARWFRVFRPKSFQAGNPAVVLLHGGTQSMRKIFEGNHNASQHWEMIAKREGILLIVPNGTARNGNTKGDRQNWNDLRTKEMGNPGTDDVKFIETLVVALQEDYKFDAARVFVTGASNGGMMSFRMLIEKPELFAAGVVFVSSLPENYDRLQRPSLAKPLMMCNGTADPLVKWQGGDVGRNRGRTCRIEEAVRWWVETNQCEPKPTSVAKLADNDKSDGCRVVHQVYAPKTGGSAFEFVKIVGGGHTLPSIQYSLPDKWLIQRLIGPMCHDIEGAEMAWEFMKKHRRSANLIN